MEIREIPVEQTLPLRQLVLWPKQPLEFCQVEEDDKGKHFGAFVDDQLVCVASIFFDDNSARLRKFATHSDFQHQGIGSKILTTIIADLKVSGITHFWCDARETAVPFYQRFGMQAEGERFFKEGVSYFKMSLSLISIRAI